MTGANGELLARQLHLRCDSLINLLGHRRWNSQVIDSDNERKIPIPGAAKRQSLSKQMLLGSVRRRSPPAVSGKADRIIRRDIHTGCANQDSGTVSGCNVSKKQTQQEKQRVNRSHTKFTTAS